MLPFSTVFCRSLSSFYKGCQRDGQHQRLRKRLVESAFIGSGPVNQTQRLALRPLPPYSTDTHRYDVDICVHAYISWFTQ